MWPSQANLCSNSTDSQTRPVEAPINGVRTQRSYAPKGPQKGGGYLCSVYPSTATTRLNKFGTAVPGPPYTGRNERFFERFTGGAASTCATRACTAPKGTRARPNGTNQVSFELHRGGGTAGHVGALVQHSRHHVARRALVDGIPQKRPAVQCGVRGTATQTRQPPRPKAAASAAAAAMQSACGVCKDEMERVHGGVLLALRGRWVGVYMERARPFGRDALTIGDKLAPLAVRGVRNAERNVLI